MKSILFFDINAKTRRAIEKAVGRLDQFSNGAWRFIARDAEHARLMITRAQRAARCPLKFLVTDEAAFVDGWGVHAGDAAFGGPFSGGRCGDSCPQGA